MQLKFTFVFSLLILVFTTAINAQQTIAIPTTHDTLRVIQIIKSNTLRSKIIDSVTTIETAAGNVVIKEGLTTMYCDSVVFNHHTNIIEAFGNVHINDNDSIHTYGQYLKYTGADRIAHLKKSVKLTDKKGVLLTDDLEYNLRTGVATYKNGGKVFNGKTILTSKEGVYFANTKDVRFKKNVHLTDPKYNITTDSLLYNANTNIAQFIAPTHIVSKDGIIDTKSGTYNLNSGEAVFFDRTYFSDSTHFISGDKIASDEKTGLAQIDGNGKFVDSVNKVTIFGGHLELNRKDNSFLAYLKPVMMIYKDNDTTYIAADTLFSGPRKYDSAQKKETIQTDTLNKKTVIKLSNQNIITDSVATNELVESDSLSQAASINLNKKDSAVRYFLGFHHVRIFNDSMQAISDSLYYNTQDSTFKLFGKPIVWNKKNQITGDTIYLFTQNQKPKRLYVFNTGLIINQTSQDLFNQIGGRTVNGFFKDGNIDYVRIKGSPAESIFYPQDEKDSSYSGMNRCSGDVIDVYFANKELNKVKFINSVDGVMYPIRQIPADKKQLKNFKWWDAVRPKNKLELFE